MAEPSGVQVRVPFSGQEPGVGELSWGQRTLWHEMGRKRTWLPIGAVTPMPAGATVADAIADLRFAATSYPTVRTRLRLDPDGPKQVVAAAGEIPLELVEADPAADPAAVAAQVRQRYWQRDYDFTSEWPVRMAVIRHRGALTHRVWVMCHLVTDGAGARVILRELAGRDSAGSRAAQPPLAQARWQASAGGQRQCQAVLRYMERLLRAAPARRFPDPSPPAGPRYWLGGISSPATRLAVQILRARTRTESATVLLAVFATALARVTGINPVLIQPTVNNRFRPGLAMTVSPVMQLGLCVVEVPDATVDEAVLAARRRVFAGYKYAYYDPVQRQELLARVSQERGEPVEIGCLYNDLRSDAAELDAAPPPSGRQVRDALADSRFEWTEKQDHRPYDSLFVHIEDAPGTAEVTAAIDAQRFSPELTEACLREVEHVAVTAALDPDTRTKVAAPARL